jgi:hypothetical protein
MNIRLNQLEKDNGLMHFNTVTGEKKSQKQIMQEKLEKKDAQGKTVNAMELSLVKDIPTQKKLAARKQAVKKRGEVFSEQLKTDQEIASRQEHMAELEKEAVNAQNELDKLTQSKEKLAEAYKDNLDSDEYKEKLLELEKAETEWKSRVDSAKSEKDGESATINGIKLALLKSDPMVKASKEANDIMDKSNKDIVNELVGQAKDNMEEKLEEKIEDAKKVKEEKEEEEKKKVEREKKQEQYEKLDDTKNSREVAVENSDVEDTAEVVQTAGTTHDRIQQEIKNLIKTQQLVEEDLKGLEIDQQM